MTKSGESRNIRVLQFLDAYEKQESLWNPGLESYKNKSARDDSYMQIIQDLHVPSLTIQDVKLKVKSIRTTYTKELRLLTKYRDEGKSYNPKLFWFNRANSFLKNVSLRDKRICRGKLSNTSKDYNACVIDYIPDISEPQNLGEDQSNDICHLKGGTENDTSCTYEYKNLRSIENESQIEEDMVGTERNEDSHHTHASEFQSQVSDPNDNIKFGTTNSDHHTVKDNLLVTNQSTIKHKSSNEDDEYDVFCQSVAAQLRSISDTYSRSVAKLKIQQILFEAETGHYRCSPCITIPVSQHLNNI